MDRSRQNTEDVFALYLDGVRIENEAGEWTALDVFSLVGDGNLPFTNFIRLKSGREDSIVIAYGTSKDPICRGKGFNLNRTSANAIRVNLFNEVRNAVIRLWLPEKNLHVRKSRPRKLTRTSTMDPIAQGSIPENMILDKSGRARMRTGQPVTTSPSQ